MPSGKRLEVSESLEVAVFVSRKCQLSEQLLPRVSPIMGVCKQIPTALKPPQHTMVLTIIANKEEAAQKKKNNSIDTKCEFQRMWS